MYATETISDYLLQCDDIEMLKQQILPLLETQRSRWKEKIAEILRENHYSCRDMAKLCRVSEQSVRKWRNGSLPQSRDMFLRIGFAAGYDLEAMNRFLSRCGRYSQLYARSLEDSVAIFILRSQTIPHTYEAYQELLGIVENEIDLTAPSDSPVCTTRSLMGGLQQLQTVTEMLEFARENVPSYRRSYGRLYRYIIAFLNENLASGGADSRDRGSSFHQMASESNWSSSLRHCISQIRNQKWFPQRNKIISLGLHLNMDVSAINQMLSYARMEPLYPKNPVEAAVIWAVNEAVLCSEEGELMMDGSRDLCLFVKDILLRLEISESEYLIDDL